MTETDLKDKLTLLFELLEDVPPFAADDVETVIEGVTLELYKKELKAFIKLLYRFYIHISFINDTFSVLIFLPTLDWRKKQLVQFQQRQMPCQTC